MIKERNRKMLETFMRNVTWLRKQHGLSKKHMAQILGIGVGSLNKIENGQMPQRLGVEILERILYTFWRHTPGTACKRACRAFVKMC